MPLVLLSIFLFVRAMVTELIKNSILLSESEITSSYDLSFFSYFPVFSLKIIFTVIGGYNTGSTVWNF